MLIFCLRLSSPLKEKKKKQMSAFVVDLYIILSLLPVRKKMKGNKSYMKFSVKY